MTTEKILLKINQIGAALILITPIIYSSDFIFPYVFLKNIIFHFVILLLFVPLVWYLFEKGQFKKKINWLALSLVFFILIQTLASFFGVNIPNSLLGSFERMDGLLHLVLIVVYFFLLINSFIEQKDWVKLFRFVLFIPLALIIISLFKNGFDVVNNQWSAIGNSAFLGVYLLLHLGAGLIVYFLDKSKYWRYFYLFSLAVNFIFLLLASSRAPIVGLVIGLALGGIFYMPASSQKYKITYFSIFIGLIILGSLSFVFKDSKVIKSIKIVDRITHISIEDSTTSNRLLVWQSGLESFADRPILGYGPENIQYGINKHYNPKTSEQWFDRSHNFVIDYLNSSGVIGLLSYLLIFASTYYFILKSKKLDRRISSILLGIITAYLATMLFVFDTLNTWLPLILVLAFINWYFFLDADNKDIKEKLNKYFYPVLGITILITLVLLGYIVISPYKNNSTITEAYKYSQADVEKSLSLYDQVFSSSSFSKREAALQIGRYALSAIGANETNLSVKKTIFEAAEKHILEFLETDPHNLQVRMMLGQIYLAYSEYNTFYPGEVITLLQDNISDSPERLEIYYMIAQSYVLQGDFDSAVEWVRQAYFINNDTIAVYENLLGLYTQTANNALFEELTQEYLAKFSDELTSEQYRRLGQYYFQLGEITKSEDILINKAIPADPTSWRSYVSLASLYEAQDQMDKAISYIESVLLEHPEWSDILEPYLEQLNSEK